MRFARFAERVRRPETIGDYGFDGESETEPPDSDPANLVVIVATGVAVVAGPVASLE
ncbi:hypothetical protein [Natronococcus wangiae]|uniref:hypothetical protein n=1 Tax=Natronococcus wangiae TaxID=3068275 RepID=UPI00273E9809|nr:hypothetical protein [Natronococcus sp. AD5]